MRRLWIIVAFTLLALLACQPAFHIPLRDYTYQGLSREEIEIHHKAEAFLLNAIYYKIPLTLPPKTRIKNVHLDKKAQRLWIDFTKEFSYVPLRPANVTAVREELRGFLPRKYREFELTLTINGIPLWEWIPNFFRADSTLYDPKRRPDRLPRPRKLVIRENALSFPQGLDDRYIALWPSHGWYYNQQTKRWEWQRPRLFQSVEDLLTASFVLPYLVPMLERAGATVLLPRERCWQDREVIADNDTLLPSFNYREQGDWQTGLERGFAIGKPPYQTGDNPFRQGSYRFTYSDTIATDSVAWIPNIPATGQYCVYVSYKADSSRVKDARYTVYHAGGKTHFTVNQQMGDRTWIYLGTFTFFKGQHAQRGKVVLTNESMEKNRTVCADGVRFGGGMGDIAREGVVSGRPRWQEGARYWLQFAGYPDSIVYNLNGGNSDYKDDYQSRGEWVNFLCGKYTSAQKGDSMGLGIPIDLSLAFHTDAGIEAQDSIRGTLAIYSLNGADSSQFFPDSVWRMANRDLADLVQTQVVEDIQRVINPDWRRRALLDAGYSEAYRPNVPAMILELLSHQNFMDMRYAHDPAFKFTVARAVYKGIVKFLAVQLGRSFKIAPLPVTHFAVKLDSSGRAHLRWKEQDDPLEPEARSEGYLVYVRRDSLDWDNGTLVSRPFYQTPPLIPGSVYRFKVTAVNSGGESLDSEILAAGRAVQQKGTVAVINAFDRLASPAVINFPAYAGFAFWEDEGVAERWDLSFTGRQQDFERSSSFRMNDAPGFGASNADWETSVIAGNTFDYAAIHGKAFLANGFSFVSASDEAVMAGRFNLELYDVVDIILGEEKTTHRLNPALDTLLGPRFITFPPQFQWPIRKYVKKGGNLLVSGAYVGRDLFKENRSSVYQRFAEDILRIYWVTDHAGKKGLVVPAQQAPLTIPPLRFNTAFSAKIYRVESPDAINPINGSKTILRYAENGFSAATAYQGEYKNVVMGFPLETIIGEQKRQAVVKAILDFFFQDPQNITSQTRSE